MAIEERNELVLKYSSQSNPFMAYWAWVLVWAFVVADTVLDDEDFIEDLYDAFDFDVRRNVSSSLFVNYFYKLEVIFLS